MPRDPLWSWKFRLLESEILLWQSKFEESDSILADAPPANAPSDIAVRRLILQGRGLCRLGKSAESEAVFEQAGSLIKPLQRTLQAELEFARGRCTLTGNRRLAQSHYQQAALLAHGSDKFLEGYSLLTLGYLLFSDGRYSEAIDTLTRALSTTDSPLLREEILGDAGECYAELGDWRQSTSFGEQAEQLAAQINNVGDQEAWLIDLGRARLVLREYPQAEPYYIKALAIARGQNDRDGLLRCLNNLTELALRRHDVDTAQRHWKEESSLNLGGEGEKYITFDAAKISLERQDFSQAEHLLKALLNATPSDSLRLITEQELGNAYWREGAYLQADRMFRKAIDDAETIINRLPWQYQMSFLDEQPFYDDYMRFLNSRGRTVEALKIAERGRSQILSQVTSASRVRKSSFDLRTVQAFLKKRSQIAFAYSLTDDESFLWVITPSRVKLFHLPSHKALRPLIDAYTSETVDHPRAVEDSPGAQELYKTLVQPAESLIPKGSRVVIIPSKILSLVNFEALVVPGDHPHYWIDDVEMETASSLALLAHSTDTRAMHDKNEKDLLLLGNPLEADKSFPTLLNAPEEMNRVRSHFPASQETVVSGKDAVPQAYRGSDPGEYKFIHIDAHSAASDVNPLDSFVVLSPSGNDSYKLYAHDITATPLQADLVTISACYGAGTRWYNGEGIVGLGWAFLRAGAHQVVASLWAVDDASTPQLMDDFYSGLSKGESAAEALRAAKLRMLHSGGPYSRPYYWASLQLYTGS